MTEMRESSWSYAVWHWLHRGKLFQGDNRVHAPGYTLWMSKFENMSNGEFC